MKEYEKYLEKYEIVDEFPASGQKKVFLVKNSEGLLVFKTGRFDNEDYFKRAKREVRIQQGIDSAYFPKIFQFIEIKSNGYVILEEYIESVSLKNLLDKKSEWSSIRVAILLTHLIQGLLELWKQGNIHRDLKPANILIKPSGKPVIIDLGIVFAEDLTNLTNPNQIFGPCTPNYSAPEQLRVRRYSIIDHRTDQFILATVMWQLINAGKHPFDPKVVGFGKNIPFNIINGNRFKDQSRSINSSLEFILDRMISKEQYQRFRKPEIILTELSKIV